MLAQDGVGARRIDDRHVAQQLQREPDLQQRPLAPLDGGQRVAHAGDDRGGRRYAFAQDACAHERVDEGGFPRVELADHNEEKWLIEVELRLTQLLDGLRRGTVAHQQLANSSEHDTLVAQQRTCRLVENACRGGQGHAI